jgi:head-tail adaptor
MRIFDGKVYRDMTAEEIAEMNAQAEQVEREYWANISYDEAVNAEIRKKYSESQEFAILRQATAKPEEYEAYFAYCEECKAFVKSKKGGIFR